MTSPADGLSSPAAKRSKAISPAPFSPITPMTAPLGAHTVRLHSGGKRAPRNSIAMLDRITLGPRAAIRSQLPPDRHGSSGDRLNRSFLRASAARGRARSHHLWRSHGVTRIRKFPRPSDFELPGLSPRDLP